VNEKEVKVHELLNANDPNYPAGHVQTHNEIKCNILIIPPFDTNLLTHM